MLYTYDSNTNELYHYGVKGMKWGHRKQQRLEGRVSRKYARAGKLSGRADYYREQASDAVKKHESNAKMLDKAAKQYEKQGQYFRAEASRKAAAAIRQRGANIKAEHDATVARLEKKISQSTEKASAYASKKKVDLGKKRIDSILKESRAKGYKSEKETLDFQREWELQNKLGDAGYDAYNKIRGKS